MSYSAGCNTPRRQRGSVVCSYCGFLRSPQSELIHFELNDDCIDILLLPPLAFICMVPLMFSESEASMCIVAVPCIPPWLHSRRISCSVPEERTMVLLQLCFTVSL